jgi:hypothetical protein
MNHRSVVPSGSPTLRSLVGLAVVGAALLQSAPAQISDATAQNSSQADPPSRVARISFAKGNVSLEPAGVDTFAQAEINYPLTAGDRVYADLDALAELETAGLSVRLANGADVTLSSLSDQVAQLGLAQGSIHVVTRDLSAPDGTRATVEIDTPNGTILVQSPGDFRVDSYPQDDSTVVTVTSGQVQVEAANLTQVLGANQSFRLAGAAPVTAQFVALLDPDPLDRFDQDRESLVQASLNADDQYVSPGTIGAEDLDQYGDWNQSSDYGAIWYPRVVTVGWVPYHNGHWCWVAPWGWTWVEYEPWGFAPFHYGRWTNLNGRWGWIPGPPPRVIGRPVRPFYSPALVAFVGGGPGAGAGIAAWFPLGPGEPFVPWYHSSPGYINRVNVTNLYTRNPSEFRAAYANRSTSLYGGDARYANRAVATTAVNEHDFASGHSIIRSQPVRLDAAAREQLNQAPILSHPLVSPTASIAAPQTPARAVPPRQGRPALETWSGSARPAAPPDMNPVHPPMTGPVTMREPESTPAYTPAPTANLPRPRRQQPEEPAPTQRPPEQPRPLINRAEPQPGQPSFEQQRQEIERHEPGRPLAPQQVENMRSGRPAGPPPQPAPTARPETRPAPQPAARPAPKGPPKPP